MSTSVTGPGTTPQVGRSGRFMGIAAVGLAAVIAIGVTFAVNQGTNVSNSGAETASWQTRTELMEKQYARALAVHPAFNIEKYKLENGIIGVAPTSTFNTEQYWMDVQQAERAREAWSFQLERAQSEERAQEAWSAYIAGLTDWFSGNTGSAQGTP